MNMSRFSNLLKSKKNSKLMIKSRLNGGKPRLRSIILIKYKPEEL